MSINLFSCVKKENKETQERFDVYVDTLLKEEYRSDYMNYHYSIINGEAIGIDKPEVSLGSLSLESTLESIQSSKDELEKLHTFDIRELNDSQQDIYRLLEIQLEENIEYEKYVDFDYCFGENEINDGLITNFTEFRIQNVEDVEDYITLLKDTERYIDEGISRTQQQAEKGYIQNELIQNSIIKSCKKFLESEEIEKYFHHEISKLDISDSKKSGYEKEVNNAVYRIMKPAYQKIIDLYEDLPESKYQGSLSEMKNGKEYFEYLLKVYVGKDRNANEWIKILENEIDETMRDWVMIMITNNNIYDEVENVTLPYDNAQELVEYLERCIDKEFPRFEKIDYEVSYLDKSVASDLTSAYYVVPPIDAPNKNVIKVNPNNTDIVSLFSTLAHEGFPGHLYQNNYFIQQNKALIYHLLKRLGSSEGWAEYVGMDAYRIGNIGSEDLQNYMKDMNYLNMILVEYVDLKVNYSGWNVKNIENYLDEVGLVSDIAQNLYENVIMHPAIYAPYSLGTYEVLRLREMAEDKLGEKFDALSFHQAYLDVGTLHFDIIEKHIEKYIENK